VLPPLLLPECNAEPSGARIVVRVRGRVFSGVWALFWIDDGSGEVQAQEIGRYVDSDKRRVD
jgi:hypothetical protein